MRRLATLEEARRLRDYLDEYHYTRQGLIEAVSTDNAPTPQLRNLARLLYLSEEPTPINRLARWFLGGVAVAAREARQLFAAEFLDLCLDLGLLESDKDQLAPGLLLEPYGEAFLIAADTYQKLGSKASYDYVLALNPTAQYLLDFTMRRPVAKTLDLGTGNGILALAASRHSAQVTATDLNQRAILFAAFNARLHGIDNIEFRSGNLFEPVAGQRFDLIVSNPPFVLAPSKRYLYRDSDFELDRLCRSLVKQVAGFLNDGAYYQMLCDWVEVEGQPWQERLQEWFSGCGCDVLVYHQYEQEPLRYAYGRLREVPFASQAADATAFKEWMDFYRSRRVTAMHGGLIAMRRRQGENWLVMEELRHSPEEAFGNDVLARFASEDFLRSHGESDLLNLKLRAAPGLTLSLQQQWQEGRWRTAGIEIHQSQGMGYTVKVDGLIAGFLEKLDGTHRLGELIEALAEQTGAEASKLRPQVIATVRGLISQGFVGL